MRGDRKEVDVVRARRAARPQLAERLLLRREPRRGGFGEQRPEPVGAVELELDERVVVQVPADAAQLEDGGDPRRLEVGRIADARALQDRGRAVRAGGEHDRRRRDPLLAPAPPDDHLATAARRRRRSGHRGHGRESSGSVAPRAGSMYAKAALTLTPPSMLTGSMPKPMPAVEVVEVVGPRQAERRGRVEAEAMERADLVVR